MSDKTLQYMTRFSNNYYTYELSNYQKLLDEKETGNIILNNVSLQIKKGSIVALLGRNGAGKTTITSLLTHSYEPTSGEVKINNVPLYSYDQNELLQQFGLIHQRPFVLYRFTIKENALFGVRNPVSDDDIWSLFEEIDLAAAIKKFPHGLDTILGEGVGLSGGQEQLLAVARTLLQKRPFLIFDEGMNQLDIEHETKVMNVLKKRTAESGVLFITHRITTARRADYIYMLDEGKIAEAGTHIDLIKQDDFYANFWHMQVID